MKEPKYTYGDIVSFDMTLQDGRKISCTGTVEIIDRYGTFEQNEEPSYDVMVQNWDGSDQPMFVKHLRESVLRGD